MAVVTLPVVTNPQGAHLVDVNGNPISSADGGFPTVDRIRSLVMAGQGFAVTTGIISTGAGSNDFIGLQLLANAIARNVLIYNAFAMVQNITGDVHLNQGTTNTTDAGLTTNLAGSVVNQAGAGFAGSSLTSIIGSPANTTETAGFVGTTRFSGAAAANVTVNMLQTGSGIFIPKGGIGFGVIYIKIPVTANSGAATFEWVEF